MKFIFLLISLGSLNMYSFAQTKIELNTKFKFKLEKSDSLNYSFKIMSKEHFKDTVDMSSSVSYLTEEIGKDEVVGIFCIGKVGPTIQDILLIKNGLPNPIKYTLTPKSSSYNLLPQTSLLASQEISSQSWEFKIDHLFFSSFNDQ